MFDLENEVLSWSRAVHHSGPGHQERADELADHLLCEIACGVEQGLEPELAFQAAIRRLGESEQLETEFGKNRNAMEWAGTVVFALATCNVKTLRRELSPKQASGAVILVSLFFAGLMLVMAQWTKDSEHSKMVTPMLIALWFVPYSLLIAAGASRGGRCRERRAERQKA